jgi:hypothetical protein
LENPSSLSLFPDAETDAEAVSECLNGLHLDYLAAAVVFGELLSYSVNKGANLF